MNDFGFCFRLDGDPPYYRGYPRSHLLAIVLEEEHTLEFFFTAEVITVKGTDLSKLQEALLRGSHTQMTMRPPEWRVTSVSRRYYGAEAIRTQLRQEVSRRNQGRPK